MLQLPKLHELPMNAHVDSTRTEAMARLPLLRQFQEARYTRRFFAHHALTHHLYRGVFPSFDEARASIPPSSVSGYDNTESADLYRERTRRVFINDYPMIYWLGRWFANGAHRVFDIGGHIGIAYYAYQKYLDYPSHLSWTVMDVPAVNAAGARWASQNDMARQLHFADDVSAAAGSDVLFAAGSLQYLSYSLEDALRAMAIKPRFLLLNSVPIHMRESYFTVQNIGTACCPYRITAEREFLGGLAKLGYEMQDRWENPQRSCIIPFHPERSLDRYFGFAFRLNMPTTA
ncbi:putative methyltransferase (TIGR04325 family) [Luteibacter sp. OK325]|uniref:TIGR04325 family methyltransferase n=1 Tax=Luteibacter sp. OK325 TaxID=2135670 RepID=UPI000D352CFF|nr:TIGR04325 family methyltransferase [Luteibacter sp. OK325]PTR33827.1 putative methyltransferase (TIGR04325 family) [Luteibacter sp. OK325]